MSFYFVLYVMYAVEVFPSSASGIGYGLASACGTFGSSTISIVLGVVERANINKMFAFLVYGMIGIGIAYLLKETQGVVIPAEI